MSDKRTILVLEDDDCIREMLCEVLADHGYDVHGVEDGRRGLEILPRKWFDIIISDFSVPGINGDAFVREARLCFPEAHIVGISALPYGNLFMEAGADMFLLKPFTPGQLLSLLPLPVKRVSHDGT